MKWQRIVWPHVDNFVEEVRLVGDRVISDPDELAVDRARTIVETNERRNLEATDSTPCMCGLPKSSWFHVEPFSAEWDQFEMYCFHCVCGSYDFSCRIVIASEWYRRAHHEADIYGNGFIDPYRRHQFRRREPDVYAEMAASLLTK